MRDGVIEQHDMPREIYRRPRTRFAANFIGRANMIEGRIGADRVSATASDGLRVVSADAYDGAGDDVTAVFRAENVALGDRMRGAENRWTATVERVTFLGRHLDLALRLPSGVIRAEVPIDEEVRVGASVEVGVRARDVHFVPADAA